jgi:hypothetical protein
MLSGLLLQAPGVLQHARQVLLAQRGEMAMARQAPMAIG